MLRFHSASVVSWIGADDAIPAFDTRMSTPPNSIAVVAKQSITCASSVTSICTARTTSPP